MSLDIEFIKRKLLIKYPSFGSVIANMEYIEDYNCRDYNGNPTAATDGDAMYYHPNFINSLTEDEQVFIFAHEVCHKAFDHIFRSEGKEHELWNIATDGVINAQLKKDGLPLIKGGVDIEGAENYTAEELYQKLLKEQKQSNSQANNNQDNKSNNSQAQNTNQSSNSSNNQNQTSQENNNSSEQKNNNESNSNTNNNITGSRDVGHDSHDMWNKAVEKRKKQQQGIKDNSKSQTKENQDKKENKTSNFFDKIFNRNKEKNASKEKENPQESESNKPDIEESKKKKQEEQIKKLTEMGEKKAFKQNKIERKKQLQELRDALAKQSIDHGRGTNQELRQIENIGTATPLIDWRKLLKEAVKYNVDWSYDNATIEEGVVTPYLEEIAQPETEIVLDTSGSIDSTLLRNFLRECKNILQNSKLKVGCFDDRFYGFTEIKNENDIDNMKFIGGGGTNFDAAVNAFSRRVENKIIFTDGWSDMPSKSIDAIWIVFGGRKINPKGGRVINITVEQLQRLSLLSVEDITKSNQRKR